MNMEKRMQELTVCFSNLAKSFKKCFFFSLKQWDLVVNTTNWLTKANGSLGVSPA